MMRPLLSVGVAVTAVVLLAAPFVTFTAAAAHAALSPAQKCAAAKEKATAKNAVAKLKCHKKTKLTAAADPACLQKAEDNFTAAFAKAEAAGGCDVTGDADSIETQVDTFVSAVVQALQPSTRSTTTPEQKCATNKLQATSNDTTAQLKCHQQSLSTGSLGVLAACLAKAEANLDTAFTKADATGGCTTTGNAGTIKDTVNTFVNNTTNTLLQTPTPTFPPGVPTYTPSKTPTATHTPTPTTAPPQCDPTSPPSRFVDNGDGTLTDTQTGLMWEKKDDSGGVHDKDLSFPWARKCSDSFTFCQPDAASAALCAAVTGGALGCAECSCPTEDNSTTIWQWIPQLSGFAGYGDWRIPTINELQTIPPGPPPAFCRPACTPPCNCAVGYEWSTSTYLPDATEAWTRTPGTCTDSSKGTPKHFPEFVRAVRG